MAADEAPIWYLREGSRSVGPFTIQEMKARLRVIPNWQSIYVWREGFDDWAQAGSVPELHEVGPPPFKQAPKRKSIPIRIARALVFIVGVSLFATLAKLGIRAVFQSSPSTAAVSIEELFAATVATAKPKLPQRVDDETTLVDIAADE
jgi:hypothetical protein